MGASRIPIFRDLQVWKKAMDLVVHVYEVTKAYPSDERFGLVAETRKTVRSVPYNVAEGKMRSSVREYRHFVPIASGSLGELWTQLLLAQRLRYVSSREGGALEGDIEEIGRMLHGLERSLS